MTNCRYIELLLGNTPNFTYGYNIPLYIIYFFNLVKELSFSPSALRHKVTTIFYYFPKFSINFIKI